MMLTGSIKRQVFNIKSSRVETLNRSNFFQKIDIIFHSLSDSEKNINNNPHPMQYINVMIINDTF